MTTDLGFWLVAIAMLYAAVVVVRGQLRGRRTRARLDGLSEGLAAAVDRARAAADDAEAEADARERDAWHDAYSPLDRPR